MGLSKTSVFFHFYQQTFLQNLLVVRELPPTLRSELDKNTMAVFL
jgi:hypothetical protein